MDVRKVVCVGAAGFLGTLLVGAAVFPAHAQELSNPVTVTGHPDSITRSVSFADLTLKTRHDRGVLMHRVDLAVGKICTGFDGNTGSYDADDCRNFAWAGARPQIKRAFDQALSGQLLATAIQITAVAP